MRAASSLLKTLILCVDRDDDLGQKGEVETPIVGRRANVAAATALGLADPEDSDTNAVFAAVNIYDKQRARARTDDQYEVATVTGHPRMGIRGDRKLARELDEVLAAVRPDDVILVSDGAEDERILPIIQGRIPVAHVHRSVVKQAPRLEGFYYVLTRLLDDRKQAMRFVLPLGIILSVWGASILTGYQDYAAGATLGIAGLWLIVHAMKWEGAVGRFFADIGEGIRAGKASLLANIGMILVLVFGAVTAWEAMPDGLGTNTLKVLYFSNLFLPWLVAALLLFTGGQLFDAWVREGRAGIRLWSRAFTLIALFFVGSVAIEVTIEQQRGLGLNGLTDLDRMVRLVSGFFIWAGGTVLTRYLRGFFPASPMRER